MDYFGRSEILNKIHTKNLLAVLSTTTILDQLTYNILSVLWNYALVLAMFQTNGDNYVQTPFYCICQKRGCNGQDGHRSVKIHFHNPDNYFHQSDHGIHKRNWAAHAWTLTSMKHIFALARLLLTNRVHLCAWAALLTERLINVDDLSPYSGRGCANLHNKF